MFNYITQTEKSQQVIQEISKRKYQQKLYAPLIAEALKADERISENSVNAIFRCGTFISVNTTGQITSANFCKNRYCPICQWRASRKIYSELAQVCEKLASETERFALLTLTIRNSQSLKDGIEQCFDGLKRFINQRKFKKAFQGFLRTLEITYNDKHRTWHPHIHMILHLQDAYFSDKNIYLTQEDIETLWRNSVRASYITQVDIRAIKNGEDMRGAIAEVAKYAIKPSSVLTSTSEQATISELIRSTYRRRLRSFGGTFKKVAHALGIQAEPTDELPGLSPTDTIYIYTKGTYKKTALTPQTCAEFAKNDQKERQSLQQSCNCCKNNEDLAGGGAL